MLAFAGRGLAHMANIAEARERKRNEPAASSPLHGLAAETFAPALDAPMRGRREMGGAAQGRRVAIALEESAPRRRRLRRVHIETRRQPG